MTLAPRSTLPKVHFAQYRPQISYGRYLAGESHEGLESGHSMLMNRRNVLHCAAPASKMVKRSCLASPRGAGVAA
jgi:hypothetical protein